MKIISALPVVAAPARTISREQVGMMLAVASLLMYGTYNAFAKSLTPFLSPVSLLLLSEALTAIFVILTTGLLPLLKTLARARGKEIFIAIGVGILSSGIAPLLWFIGLTQTTATNASILNASSILFALLIDRYMLRERINILQFLGACVVFLGIATITLGQSAVQHFNIGDIFIISTGIFYGFGTALYKKYLTKLHPEAALLVRSLTGVIFALVLVSFIGHPLTEEVRSFPVAYLATLFAFVFFSRFLHLSFFYGALERTTANKVVLVDQASPLAGMMFAVLLLGEQLYGYHFIGVGLMMTGLLIEHVSSKRVNGLLTGILKMRLHHQQGP